MAGSTGPPDFSSSSWEVDVITGITTLRVYKVSRKSSSDVVMDAATKPTNIHTAVLHPCLQYISVRT